MRVATEEFELSNLTVGGRLGGKQLPFQGGVARQQCLVCPVRGRARFGQCFEWRRPAHGFVKRDKCAAVGAEPGMAGAVGGAEGGGVGLIAGAHRRAEDVGGDLEDGAVDRGAGC